MLRLFSFRFFYAAFLPAWGFFFAYCAMPSLSVEGIGFGRQAYAESWETPEDASPDYSPDFARALQIPEILEGLKKGTLRPAMPEDIDAWVQTAKRNKRGMDYYHPTTKVVFYVQRPFRFPATQVRGLPIAYFISAGIPFPKGKLGEAIVYDIRTGNWATEWQYEDGTGEHLGAYPLGQENE